MRRIYAVGGLFLLLISAGCEERGARTEVEGPVGRPETVPTAQSAGCPPEYWISPEIVNSIHPLEDVPFLSDRELSAEQASRLEEAVTELEDDSPISYVSLNGTRSTKPSDYLWRKTEHAYGFVDPLDSDGRIVHAGNLSPDVSLRGASMKITLNRLRVADYPGKGAHQVLFDFEARNQLKGGHFEQLHFNQVYRVDEGQGAGVIGYPIYLGLNVGDDGLAFQVKTVNVMNESDERLLQIVESDVGKNGLRLLGTAQPALAPFTEMAKGMFRMVLARRKNLPVQDVFVGLDFSSNQFGARLREGDYVVVQIPDAELAKFKWDDWKYDKSVGAIVDRKTGELRVPFNYFVLGVTRYNGS